MQLSKNNNINFGALHVANCGNIKLYKAVTQSDYNFIKQLPDKIDTKTLMPQLSKDAYARWNEMIQYASDNALNKENTTYLEFFNNKPCGIITFKSGKTFDLDCICTWPVEIGKKVQQAGQILFYQLFCDFKKIKGKKIKLEAITNGPYNTVQKYEKLGFKQLETLPTKIKMEITSPKVDHTLSKLSKELPYEEQNNEKVVLSTDLY